MPTYAYECQACGHGFEEFQSMTAGALRKCPECGKLKLQRLIGPGAGVIFKGGGFYQTDYRSESYKSGQKAEKDGPRADGGAGEGKAPEPKSTGGDASKEPGSKATGGDASKDPGSKGTGKDC